MQLPLTLTRCTIVACATLALAACGGASTSARTAASPQQPSTTRTTHIDTNPDLVDSIPPPSNDPIAVTGDLPPHDATAITPTPGAQNVADRARTTGVPRQSNSAPANAPDDNAPASTNTGGATAAIADGAIVALAGTPTIAIPKNETIVSINTANVTRTSTPTPQPTATPAPGGAPMVGGCRMFPSDNSWNQDITTLPVDANSATYISNIGGGNLHPDFGGNGAYGIPYIVVPQSQPMTAINFTDYGSESDPGPYPIPTTAPIEGGASSTGDRHVLAVQQGTCKLYEMFYSFPTTAGWNASSGAVFDLNSNALRPDTWTSADAAGLPILAGLIRYDETQAGQINHAIRFTVNTVQKAWVHPATHYGTSTSPSRIPYGAKLRLKASFDTSPYHGNALVILTALKKYGMIVADQGSSWYITGATDPRWDDNDLNQLKNVPGAMFDVVQLGQIHTYP